MRKCIWLVMTAALMLMMASASHASIITESGDATNIFGSSTPSFDLTKLGASVELKGSIGSKGDYDYYTFTVDSKSLIDMGFDKNSDKSFRFAVWKKNTTGGGWSFQEIPMRSFSSADFDAGTYILGVAAYNKGVTEGGFGSEKGDYNSARGAYTINISQEPVANPEPSAFLLTGLGLLGLFGARKKLSRSKIGSA